MRLAVLQSNYIPWKGYFDLMAMSDMFIVYDSVQYTKNDWRNRNILMSTAGPVWLTIPIATSGRSEQRIYEATVSDPRWARKHWQTVTQLLAKRPCFAEHREQWESWYMAAADHDHLHEINLLLLRAIAESIGITTPIVDDRRFELEPDTPTGKLVQLCALVGADRYVTGPAGLDYLEVDRFRAGDVHLDVIDYSRYPEYQQTAAPFQHGVSMLDVLASVGDEARSHLGGRFRCATDTHDPSSSDASGA